MATQEQISQKYQSAFQEAERRQVRISEMRKHGDILYVLAWAPSEDAKNKVWDEIKRIDPNYGDLTCDIRVGEQPQAGEVHSEFDRLAGSAGPQGLAHGLAAAFRSDQTPPFSHMVSQLYGESTGQQKAGLLNSFFAIAPQSLATEVLGMARGGPTQITPDQAEKVSPDSVQKLAEQAERHDPSVVDQVSRFYAQHPGVVKTLGLGALTLLTSKIFGGLRGRSGGGT